MLEHRTDELNTRAGAFNIRTAQQGDLGHIPQIGRPFDEDIRAIRSRGAFSIQEESPNRAALVFFVDGVCAQQRGGLIQGRATVHDLTAADAAILTRQIEVDCRLVC